MKRITIGSHDVQGLSPLDMPYLQSQGTGQGDAEWRYAQEAGFILIAPIPAVDIEAEMTYFFTPPPLVNDGDESIIPINAIGAVSRLAASLASTANTTRDQWEMLSASTSRSFQNLKDSEEASVVYPTQPRVSPDVRNPMKRRNRTRW